MAKKIKTQTWHLRLDGEGERHPLVVEGTTLGSAVRAAGVLARQWWSAPGAYDPGVLGERCGAALYSPSGLRAAELTLTPEGATLGWDGIAPID